MEKVSLCKRAVGNHRLCESRTEFISYLHDIVIEIWFIEILLFKGRYYNVDLHLSII